MHEDSERCVRAVQAKDARIDGWFFTVVVTTGIYCRPSCPVVPPKPENMRFFASAAAAQQAGGGQVPDPLAQLTEQGTPGHDGPGRPGSGAVAAADAGQRGQHRSHHGRVPARVNAPG